MPCYRLVIHRHGKRLGQFESDVPDAEAAVRTIAAQLDTADGYRLELWVADGERRLLESGPDGIRLLGREPLFRPAAL